MADEKEIVYVPQASSMFQNTAFWTGVASSLVAAAIFWYFIHDIWPVNEPSSNEEEDVV